MGNVENKNRNIIVENFIIFSLFTIVLVLKSLKTLSKIFTYGFFKKEVLTTKSNFGADIKFLVFLFFVLIVLIYLKINSKKPKNIKLNKFKNKLQSAQSNIERIFLREEERIFSDPNINIYIGIEDNWITNTNTSRNNKLICTFYFTNFLFNIN